MSTDFIQNMREAVRHLSKARDIMSRGPLDYYLAKLVEHSEALLDRYAPLKVGQRAVIARHIKCENGWAGCERTLAVGATGTIHSVDFDHGQFVFAFLPDKEWWVDSQGHERLADSPHTYRLSEKAVAAESDMGAKCLKCGRASDGWHSCPYASEIGGDCNNQYCNCCVDCMSECNMGI